MAVLKPRVKLSKSDCKTTIPRCMGSSDLLLWDQGDPPPPSIDTHLMARQTSFWISGLIWSAGAINNCQSKRPERLTMSRFFSVWGLKKNLKTTCKDNHCSEWKEEKHTWWKEVSYKQCIYVLICLFLSHTHRIDYIYIFTEKEPLAKQANIVNDIQMLSSVYTTSHSNFSSFLCLQQPPKFESISLGRVL